MSYFINPDGTISFVEDRYDSSGNMSVGRPYSMVDLNSIDYSNETVSYKRNKAKRRRKATTPVSPTLTIKDVFFEGELLAGKFVLENKKDVLNLIKWMKLMDYSLTQDEADLILSAITKANIKQCFMYRFTKYMEEQNKMLQNGNK